MSDDEQSPATELAARVAALERGLDRLWDELAALRVLADQVRAEALVEGPSPPESPRFQPPLPTRPAQVPPLPAPVEAPPPAAVPVETGPPPPPARPPGRTLGELARDWDLTGPRGLAIAGGAVLALGIGFFFVLAANRGWIDETARIVLGALASALAVGAGLVVRARYGQYVSALAAVGAGIAGGYATLAAAAARYDLVPDALALPLAAVIAAIATAIALRWRSQILAGIGLLGAALAPALQALDTELGWGSTAFAMIVALAAGAVSVPLRWKTLLLASLLLVGAQVEWLIEEADVKAGLGTVGVVGAFLLCVLGVSVGLQLSTGKRELDQLALAYALAATGTTLFFTFRLFQDQTFRGVGLLVAAAVWAVVFAGFQLVRRPEPAFVLGSAALALAAVGTAGLLSDSALTLAWAGQAALLALLAFRVRDARLQLMALAYATLATGHALAVEARLEFLFEEDADHLRAVAPLAAPALAFAAAGLLAPTRYVERTESGLLAFVGSLRALLAAHRRGLREALVFAGLALGTIASAFALVSVSYDAGHIAAVVLAAAVGAAIAAYAGAVRSDQAAVASFYWMGLVVVDAVVYEVPKTSGGGWAAVAAGAGLLAGSYAQRLLVAASRTRDAVAGVAAAFAAATAAIGIAEAATGRIATGFALLAVTIVYAAFAGAIFRRPALRDVSTALWSISLVFLVASEAVFVDSWRGAAVVAALIGAVVALLARPLLEPRLWLAGTALVAVATVVTLLFFTPLSHLFVASESPAESLWVLVGCIAALAVLALVSAFEPARAVLQAVAGAVAVYALSLGILDVAERISTASVDTDFERGHTAVSALWALVGLGLLVAGLLRGSAPVRYAGLALFGLTLAKIFLYDLAELSSIARAFSFILVGALLLAGGFFLQRLSSRIGPRET